MDWDYRSDWPTFVIIGNERNRNVSSQYFRFQNGSSHSLIAIIDEFGYPPNNRFPFHVIFQLLTSGSQATTTGTQSVSGIQSAQSPSPLSPSATTAVTSATAQLGALSPGSLSQTSTNHGPTSMVGGGGVGGGVGGGAPSAVTGSGHSSCCENGRPIMTDPVSGQTVCSCQYDSARLALSAGYAASRIPSSAGVGVYGTPYPSTDQNPYPSIGVDSSAFYSPLVSRKLV